MLRPFLLAVATAMIVSVAPVRAQSPDAAKTLNQLFAAEWERGLVEFPENASLNGDTRFNDRWTDMSLAAIQKREGEDRAALDVAPHEPEIGGTTVVADPAEEDAGAEPVGHGEMQAMQLLQTSARTT